MPDFKIWLFLLSAWFLPILVLKFLSLSVVLSVHRVYKCGLSPLNYHELQHIYVNIPSIPISVDTTHTHSCSYTHTLATHKNTHTNILTALLLLEPWGSTCRHAPGYRSQFGQIEIHHVSRAGLYLKTEKQQKTQSGLIHSSLRNDLQHLWGLFLCK